MVSIKFLEGLNTSKHGERRIHLFFPSHWLSLVISSHLITSHHITSHHIISSLFMFISDPETRIYCTGSSGSQVFVFELNYNTSFPGSTAFRGQIVSISIHNCMSQFLIINLFLHKLAREGSCRPGMLIKAYTEDREGSSSQEGREKIKTKADRWSLSNIL